jgi:hypothetical protein
MLHAWILAVFGKQAVDAIANTIEHLPNTDPTFDPFATLWNTTGTLIVPPPAPLVPVGAPTNYGVLVYPGFSSLELWGALEPLHLPPTFFNVTTIAATLDPVMSNLLGGVTPFPVHRGGALPVRGQPIIPGATFATAASLNLEVLVVPGSPRVPHSPEIARFIASQYPKLKYLISVGTGSALVAQAG